MRGELYCADAAGRTDHVKRSGYQEKEFTWDTHRASQWQVRVGELI